MLERLLVGEAGRAAIRSSYSAGDVTLKSCGPSPAFTSSIRVVAAWLQFGFGVDVCTGVYSCAIWLVLVAACIFGQYFACQQFFGVGS